MDDEAPRRVQMMQDWIAKEGKLNGFSFVKADSSQSSVVVSFQGKRINVVFPLPGQVDVDYFVLEPSIVAESFMRHRSGVSLTSLNQFMLLIAKTVSKAPKPNGSKKKTLSISDDFGDDDDDEDVGDESGGSVASSSDALSLSIGGGKKDSLSQSDGGMMISGNGLHPDLERAIEQEVDECNRALHEDAVQYMRDLEVVRVKVSLDRFLPIDPESCTELAAFFEVSLDQKFVLDFSFASTHNSDMPLVTVGMLKDKRTPKDNAVCEWIRNIVRHVQDLYFKDRKELRHFGNPDSNLQIKELDEALEKTDVFSQTAPVSKKRMKEFFSKRNKSKSSDEAAAKDILDIPARYFTKGGVCWHVPEEKDSHDDSELTDEQKVMELCSYQIDPLLAAAAVIQLPGCSIIALLEACTDYSRCPASGAADFSRLTEMGFSKVNASLALARNKWSFQDAVNDLMDKPSSDKVGEEAAQAPELKLIAIEQKNFYLCLLEFLGERLAHYQRYCISCHKAHNCRTVNAVVCPSALCVFRWEEFNLNNLIPSYQCVFEDCGSTNWAKKCLQYFGDTIENVSKKYGMSAQTVLELAFHKYLPRDEMMKFFDVIKQYKSPEVKSCLNPGLCARFERKLADMKVLKPPRTADELTPRVAYHGTSEVNLKAIAETGFLLSKLAANTGNRGYYGAGIYCSPNAQYCMGYTRGGKYLMVCAVVMGKIYTCPYSIGCGLQPGHDSHKDASNNEWVLFDEAAILPCFMFKFMP